jgi:hypothetical protein
MQGPMQDEPARDDCCTNGDTAMEENYEASLPPELIEQEARLLHRMPPRPPGRDAELALEVARLNHAVAEMAQTLSFDDQPLDFVGLLIELREKDES